MPVVQSSLAPLRQGLPFSAIVTGWCKLIESIRDPYRPELHYMRGPGPRWHAKHRSRSIAAPCTRSTSYDARLA